MELLNWRYQQFLFRIRIKFRNYENFLDNLLELLGHGISPLQGLYIYRTA